MANTYTLVYETQEGNKNIEDVIRVIDSSSPILRHLRLEQLYHMNYEYVDYSSDDEDYDDDHLKTFNTNLTNLQLQAIKAINKAYFDAVIDLSSLPRNKTIMFTESNLNIDSTQFGDSCLDVIKDKTDDELHLILQDLV